MVGVLTSTLAGFAASAVLIIAIGAQNAFVLRQGLRREHVLAVVLICALSDAALIAAGVAGGGVLFTAVPWLVDVIRWAGAAFLLAKPVVEVETRVGFRFGERRRGVIAGVARLGWDIGHRERAPMPQLGVILGVAVF